MKYAKDKDLTMINVLNALNGLKCECTCICCGEPVLSKQGKKKEWHFAHVSKIDCKYSNNPKETDLHILAKDVFKEFKTLSMDKVYFENKPVTNEYTVQFDKVELEKRVDKFTPDIIAYKGNSLIWVEIAVTHFTEKNKIDYCKENDITLIEFDLSKINRDIKAEDLKEVILSNRYNKFLWSSKVFNKISNYHAINFNNYNDLINYKLNGLNKEFFNYKLIDNVNVDLVNNAIKLLENKAKQESLRRFESSKIFIKERIKTIEYLQNWFENEKEKRFTKAGVKIKPQETLIFYVNAKALLFIKNGQVHEHGLSESDINDYEVGLKDYIQFLEPNN